MKCSCCGNDVSKTERFCSVCGENNENYEEPKIIKTNQNNIEQSSQPSGNTNVYFQSYNISANQQPKVQNGALATTAKVFCVLGCILMGFCYLIPLAWCIPMTVAIFGRMNRGEPVGVGLKVCTLLFLSLIGGILLLCMNDEPQRN